MHRALVFQQLFKQVGISVYETALVQSESSFFKAKKRWILTLSSFIDVYVVQFRCFKFKKNQSENIFITLATHFWISGIP